ncbi:MULTISPECIES: TCR/Tet family MFS transporter [unclassified Ruegeria]|uniref:TCR/Tet family MFS transporter n=1 Tax=unclassified Ruegeria TaxID=2625375 RepID=UPI001ADC529E|nr:MULTISPECIES: TCR/Tet family MFS transporter [unclassified Ruegeria]MBO9409935.1 TCR/Tet family MFS transporter [Ruegeria sp. R8_1]MBO9414846.1 TCR/Tet family MFS transporter [Ruegeria sp. R8_2]
MRPPFLFVLLTVMIDAMGIGLVLPIMPELIVEVRGGTLASAAVWGGVLSTAFAAMQFVFGPILGNLSDAYGRRAVLLVSLFVMSLDYVVMALAGSIWLLLVGRIVGGVTAATHATAAAFMADVSKPAEKAANFGLLGAAFGVGFVLGPVIGGLLSEYGTRAPFWAAAALSLVTFAIGLFVMPETVTDKTRRAFNLRRANPINSLRAIAGLPGIRPMLWVYFLYSISIYVYPAIWAYFTTERFGWSPQMIGLSLGVYGIGMAAVQGGLIRPATRYLGERGTIIYGMVIEIISFAILAFLTSGLIALLMIPLTALGAVVTPALQAMMSKATPDSQQGELQGVLTSLHALSMVISPLLMTSVFAQFARPDTGLYLPGAPFLLAMVLMVIGFAAFLKTKPKKE